MDFYSPLDDFGRERVFLLIVYEPESEEVFGEFGAILEGLAGRVEGFADLRWIEMEIVVVVRVKPADLLPGDDTREQDFERESHVGLFLGVVAVDGIAGDTVLVLAAFIAVGVFVDGHFGGVAATATAEHRVVIEADGSLEGVSRGDYESCPEFCCHGRSPVRP